MPAVARRLWPAIALAVLAHAAVLTQLQAMRAAAPRGQLGATAGTFAFHTRLIEPAPGPARPALAAAAAGSAAEPVAQPPAAATLHEPAAMAAAPAPAQPPRRRPADGAGGEPPYVPRGQLTLAPQPLAPPDIPFPADVEGIVQLGVKLSLFIDEDGRVRRVQIDSPQVPSAFARVAVESFTATRFRPGEMDGRPVRSQIQLEVEFVAPPARLQQAPLSAPGARGNLPPALQAPTPPS